MKGFRTFGLKDELLKGIQDLYFKEPTPIQKEAIPLALEGKDLIGQAQTGTGKTAAFALPMLQSIDPTHQHIQGLILTPTRELAIQITEDMNDLSKHTSINIVSLHGGRDINAQINKLQGPVHIVVGTPGRILDHLRRETLHFGRIHMLVLDEADKMLEMGFLEDVEDIMLHTNNKKQTLLFSATMPERVKQLAHRFMHQPPHIKIGQQQATTENIDQYFYVVNQSEKIEALQALLDEVKPYLAVIFVNTQKRVEEVTTALQREGLDARALHGGLSQNKREQLMNAFRDIKFQYLICTDIAARGLDVEGVTHVINFDLPNDTESYIHRVGRTGRAGEHGTAISFVSPRQKMIIRKIERGIKHPIEERIFHAGTFSEKRSAIAPTKPAASKPRSERHVEKSARKKADSEQNKTKKLSKTKKQVKPGYKKKELEKKKKEVTKQKKERIRKSIAKSLKRK